MTNSGRQGLREGWAILQSQANVAGSIRAMPLASGGARALVTEDGRLGVLLPLSEGERFRPAPALRPGSGGVIEAEVAAFSEGQASLRGLAVTCLDGALMEAFLSFCEALLKRSAAGLPVAKALEICHSEFRQLVATPAPGDLRPLVGLIGELLVLADLVLVSSSAVMLWGGQEKERHDFRAGSVGLEAKATLRSQAANRRVHISSLDQLQTPQGGRLFLHAVRLERAPGGAVSASALVERIERQLAGLTLEHFRSSLKASDQFLRDTREFAILERRTYEVREGFPALTSAKLLLGRPDNGVTGIEYDLDLGCAESFAVDDSIAYRALLPEESEG